MNLSVSCAKLFFKPTDHSVDPRPSEPSFVFITKERCTPVLFRDVNRVPSFVSRDS